MSNESRYGELIRIECDGESTEVLERVPLGAGVGQGSVDEGTLQKLLFDHPECLPIAAIDPSYGAPVAVCRELSLPAGSIDALYVNALGRLTLCEFKLWRNPQARREVIGQILDYAAALASWSYEDLQRQVSLALGGEGSNVLYELVAKRHPDVVEAEFVDNVTRHLRRGEFLLLIIGDGIRERAEKIVDFVQSHSGLHFNLALVEAALYRDGVDRLIVQPRVLARTEIVQRFVVEGGFAVEPVGPDVEDEPEILSDQEEHNRRFWRAVLADFAFSDVSIEVPKAPTSPSISVPVENSGFGGWGLWFSGYVYRSTGDLGCFLGRRKDQLRAVRVFDEVGASLDRLRRDTRPAESSRDRSWSDLEQWSHGERPRIGFRLNGDLSFLNGDEEGVEYRETVAWMRDRLNRLVSVLHPRLQRMLGED